MKKVFLLATLFCGMAAANAENVIQVVPFKAEANFVFDGDWEEAPKFDISLTNTDVLANILMFDIYLPEGLEFDMQYDGPGEAYAAEIYENSRTKFKSGPKTVSTNHEMAYNKLASDKPGFSHYRVIVSQGTTKTAFAGKEGVIGGIHYATGAIEEGVYPIYIENAEITDSNAKTKHVVPSATSYVVIGNPTVSEVAMKGIVPSFVTSKLASEAAISKLDLSAVTEVNGAFTYVDGREVVAPTADFTATAAYSKTVSKYASLTMPFDADLTDKGAYVLGSVSGTTANFTAATNVNAGDVVLLTKDVNLEGTKLGAATKSVQTEAFYVSPDGTELHKGTNVTIPALRGYWNVSAGSNLRIALDGVLTDINMVDVQGEGSDAFDLQGRQVQNAKNGVFVVNGKKQFVK